MQPETLWEKIKQNLRDGAATAAEKAEHLGKLGRARLDIARTRHAIHDAFTELGGRVYSLLEENPDAAVGQQEGVQGYLKTIKDLETRLQHQEAELKLLQAIDAPGPASDPEEV